MKATGMDLLQKIKDNEIRKGFKIQCIDGWDGIYEFDGFNFKIIGGNMTSIWNRYNIKNFLTTEFKMLEEMEEIVRAVNKLNKEKEREEK